jgi:hypothetical protein
MTTLVLVSVIAWSLGGGCGILFVHLMVSGRLKNCEMRLKWASRECQSLRRRIHEASLSAKEAIAEKEAAAERAIKAEAQRSDAMVQIERLTGELRLAEGKNADLSSNVLVLESQDKSKEEVLARQKAMVETFLFRGAKLIQEFVKEYVH